MITFMTMPADASIVCAAVIIAVLILLYIQWDFLVRLIKTPQISVLQIRRIDMSDLLVYKVSAPPPVDHDVVTRELEIIVDGLSDGTKSFAGNTTDLGEIYAHQGAVVTLKLVDIDDAGNRSEPAVLEFAAADTLAPAKPGEFAATLVREIPAQPESSDSSEASSVPEPAVPVEPVADEVIDPPATES
jgi:hypothetical protein